MAGSSRFFSAVQQRLPRSNGLFRQFLSKGNSTFENKTGIVRCMSTHRVMDIIPSYWQWNKTKDWAHFYFFVGAIPAGLLIFCSNVFIGPATLEEIPEGYEPKRWEYFRHPISRFLARYVCLNPQQEYEKLLCYTVQAFEAKRVREIEARFNEYKWNKGDSKTWKYDMRLGAGIVLETRKRLDEAGIIP